MSGLPVSGPGCTRGTDGVAPELRVDCWRELVSQLYVPLSADTTSADFGGRVQLSKLGATVVSRVEAGPHTVHRSKAMIAASERGCYKLGLQLEGDAILSQDGRQVVLRPGDFALYDTDKPYSIDFTTPTDMAVFMIPRERLRLSRAAMETMPARGVRRDDDLGTLIGPLLTRLIRQAFCDEGSSSALPMADAVVDLLSALLNDQFGERERRGVDALLLEAKSFIDQNLSDPALCPDAVAAAVHVSTRYLQKIFSADGHSVAKWIRQRRLEECRRDLISDRDVTSVGAVGARWGLPDSAHFSRVFKGHFGVSPSELHRSSRS